MLDAFDRLPVETEEDYVARTESARDEGLRAIGSWSAGALDSTAGAAGFWRHQHLMAASVMMSPLAAAQASTLAVRRARALGKQWSEALSRCTNMDQLIDVNRAYGEKAISLGAGEMWRFVERASVMGRATAAPETLKNRNLVDADSSE